MAVVTEGGRLFLSQDGGARFEPAVVPEGVSAADVALASGVLWVRTRTGSLLAARAGKVLERRAMPGALVAFAGDGAGGVVGLAADDTGRPATLVRGKADGTVECEAVQAPIGRPGTVLTARGGHLAYVVASPRGGIVLRGADGAWQRLAWEGRVTALGLVDAAGTLVAATYSEPDDTTGLVRIDAAGRASVVARLGAARDDADADGRTLAIACDEPLGVVWVAGGFGVAAFAMNDGTETSAGRLRILTRLSGFPELRLADLLTLLAVQRTGSISGAAREMRVTPSQVSKAMARLERHFGVRLLSRGARGVATDPGRAAHPAPNRERRRRAPGHDRHAGRPGPGARAHGRRPVVPHRQPASRRWRLCCPARGCEASSSPRRSCVRAWPRTSSMSPSRLAASKTARRPGRPTGSAPCAWRFLRAPRLRSESAPCR